MLNVYLFIQCLKVNNKLLLNAKENVKQGGERFVNIIIFNSKIICSEKLDETKINYSSNTSYYDGDAFLETNSLCEISL